MKFFYKKSFYGVASCNSDQLKMNHDLNKTSN